MIREEYKDAFLDEKNKKVVMIKFTETDEVIDASQIVDQGSFKYTDSSNNGDEIKIGLSESSSLEIDIKGDLVDRSGQEIYVEVIAYKETEEEVKVYPIPIGYFIISDVDYDYQLDKSHLLCYDKIGVELESKKAVVPNAPSFIPKILSNYYISIIVDGLSDDYLKENPSITIQKVIGNTQCYDRVRYWVAYKQSDGTYIMYHTERVYEWKPIIYVFDEQKKISSDFFFLIKSNEKLENAFDITVRRDGTTALEQGFWAQNPQYNYYGSGSYYTATRSVDSTYAEYPKCSSTQSLLIYPSDNQDYDLSYVAPYNKKSGIYMQYDIRCGYRYTNYSTNIYTDLRSFWGENGDNVIWTNGRNVPTTTNIFPDLVVSFFDVNSYKGIPTTIASAPVFATANKYQDLSVSYMISNLAEINGETIKVDRITGKLITNNLIDSDSIYPSNGIYPNETLLPQGNKDIVKITKDMYSMLTSRTKQSKRIGRVEVTWNNYNTGSTEVKFAQVPDYDETKYGILKLSEKNFFIDAQFLDAQTVADKILDMYKNYLFTPFELECTGLPWLEAGDWIVVETDDGQEKLNVNRRTLSGIQGMMDSLSAGGI